MLRKTAAFLSQTAFSAAMLVACTSATSPSPPPVTSAAVEAGRIAFERALPGECNVRIYVVGADGSGLTKLTEGCDHEPAWSPDGQRILYSEGGGGMAGPYHLYVVRADGSGRAELTDGPFVDHSPAWSPDGRRIAFARGPIEGADDDIFVMNADGSDVRDITNDPTRGQWSPAWSPDGQRIAFVQTPIGVGSGDLSIMNADGSAGRSFKVDGLDPAWSPSGETIAYGGGCCAVGPWIYRMAPDGSGAAELPNPNGLDGAEPAWSPDGMQLAFSLQRIDRFEIWVMSAFGGSLMRVTSDPNANDSAPSWR